MDLYSKVVSSNIVECPVAGCNAKFASMKATNWHYYNTHFQCKKASSQAQFLCPSSVLTTFANAANSNTIGGLETYGLLCGKKRVNSNEVTHLIIPDQSGTQDTCEVTDLGNVQIIEALQKENICALGWIHTHPTFDVFMSSVDLHSQHFMQRDLTETVAIVINPQHKIIGPCVGVYTLTDLGMETLHGCSNLANQFHKHQVSNTNFYKDATHCIFYENVAASLSVVNFLSIKNNPSPKPSIAWKKVPAHTNMSIESHHNTITSKDIPFQQVEKQLDSRQSSTPKLQEQGRQLSVASAAAKQRMEGIHIAEECQDDEIYKLRDDINGLGARPKKKIPAELNPEIAGPYVNISTNGATSAVLTPTSTEMSLDGDVGAPQPKLQEQGRQLSVASAAAKQRMEGIHIAEECQDDEIYKLRDDINGVGDRPKKIPAELNPEIAGPYVNISTNGATSAVLTPTSTEMSLDDVGGTGQQTEAIPAYSAKEEMKDKKNRRRVMISGKEHAVDLRAINPYKKVLSHEGMTPGTPKEGEDKTEGEDEMAGTSTEGDVERLDMRANQVTTDGKSGDTNMQANLQTKPRSDLGGQKTQFFHQVMERKEHAYSRRTQQQAFSQPRMSLLRRCDDYITSEQECVMSLSDEQKTAVINLENAIIVAISSKLCSSAMYICTFKIAGSERHYTRWMEHGPLTGATTALTKTLGLPIGEMRKFVNFQVMNKSDLVKRQENAVPGRRWKRTIETNQKSVQNSVKQLLACNTAGASLLGFTVHLDKAKIPCKLKTSSQIEYHVDQGVYNNSSHILSNHVLHVSEESLHVVETFDDFIEANLGSVNLLSFDKQARIMNSIPNDSAPSSRRGQRISSYFSIGTGDSTDDDDIDRVTSKYIPSSKRNRILYFYRLGRNCDVVNVLKGDSEPTSVSQVKRNLPQSTSRTKVVRSSTVMTTAPVPQNEINAPPQEYHFETPETTPFTKFVHHLLSNDGVFQWRIHSDEIDVIAMNDVNLDTNSFQKNQFVHVYRRKCLQPNEVSYLCNCEMLTIVSAINHDNICCHIRFMKMYVDPLYDRLFVDPSQISQTRVNGKVQRSLPTLNVPVVRLGRDQNFHRFSVMSQDLCSCSVVKLNGQRFSCLSGACMASVGHSRKLKDISDDAVCEHLRNIHQNREQWECLCHAIDDDGGEVDDIHEDIDHLICENQDPGTNLNKENFDSSTGLWVFPSISKHVPMNQDDPLLLNAKLLRLGACLSTDKCMQVSPNLDKDMVCRCGKKYYDETYPCGKVAKRFNSPTKLYTESGVVSLTIYNRLCLNENADCLLQYSGKQDGLHIFSRYTAGGDEIGWDYVKHAMHSTISFSGYCDIVSERYPPGESFMSRQTFVDFFFSWMANFKTDFRQSCHICGTNPQVLACDGTKLGIFFKNSSVSPIESSTCERTIQQQHSRTERQFFEYSKGSATEVKKANRLAQEDLLFFISKVLGKPYCGNSDRTEEQRKQNLLLLTPDKCKTMITFFIESKYHPNVMRALCPTLKLLASCYPLSSLINYRFLGPVSNTLANLDALSTSILLKELPEIFNVLQTAVTHAQADAIVESYQYIVDRIHTVHENDPRPAAATTILEQYNPLEQGRAYYFTSHGGRVRDMPKYSCNDKGSHGEGPTTCRKKFVDTTKTGMTFLFLWFDPIHGHCYGCHMVPGSEGRKDPFSSAYLYMQQPPSEVFYDFSCQLEEYSLNREPGFWRNCRFFHDIFHGFSHKCPGVYSAKCIPSLHTSINTEVCEQFNSFAQKIKYSARAMSQPHFMFYLQFFIHRWNLMKFKKLQQQRRIAVSLMQ